MDTKAEIQRAAAEWPLSLRDDPTAFGPADTWTSVTDKVNAAIRENARSAISRGLGKIVDDVAMACDLEIEENGGLADLGEVITRFAPGLDVDTTPIHEATDWTARVAAVRQVFGLAVAGTPVSTVDGQQLREFVASEPRLAHLHGAANGIKWIENKHEIEPPDFLDRRQMKDAPRYEAKAQDVIRQSLAAMEEFKPPAFVAKAFEPAAPVADEGDGWDDEPAPAVTPAPAETAKREHASEEAAAPSPIARVSGLLSELGVKDADLAAALGISRTYLSLMRKGERTWAPVTSERLAALGKITTEKLNAAEMAKVVIAGAKS